MDSRRAEFEALALPHLDAAYALARALARSGPDAEDIVQDAMVRAFRAFTQARRESVRPWLMAIVRNCFRDHIARRGRGEIGAESLDERAFEGPSPEIEAHWSGERRRLDRMLDRLPQDFREVLLLRELEDLSYRQIAEAIGAPVGTVMSRLARARAALRALWTAEEVR